MPTSAARIEANRRNSLLSTGPRTPEGKARSRTNALKTGFNAVQLRTPEDQIAAAQIAEPGEMAEEVAILTDRLRRLHEVAERTRERVMIRATTSWLEDRRGEVETLALQLPRRPSDVAAQLCRSSQGCDWMIERWNQLARLAHSGKSWDETARSLAFDLLGTDREFRDDLPQVLAGLGLEGTDLAGLARVQLERLTEKARRLARLDDFDRETACHGLHQPDTATDRRLRSYEQALHRRLIVARSQSDLDSPEPAPKIEAKLEPLPKIEAKLEPLPKIEPKLEPAIEIEPNLEPPSKIEPKLEPAMEVSVPVEVRTSSPVRQDRRARREEQKLADAEWKRNPKFVTAPRTLASCFL